ncbi:MAG: molybdenum cofactor guanylyltransferase [Deltaproteobacteria bacterium]|nr:molybdenum cofactor guanylyltransferase [Deltaproteobacteria bacterium]MBW1928695.1 molybdenum cofactor guanylyltransferase [Deltaproteobacteria bacterium]
MRGDSKNTDTSQTGLHEDIIGVILAGGKSTRYGRNKALVQIQGRPLIEHVIQVMSSLFKDIILMTNTPAEYAYLGLPMVEDIIKGLGPIGGIYTALKVMDKEAGFFVACDMPFLNKDLIHYMVSIRDDFDVVVPRVGWKIEALHGIYGKRCIRPIERNIDKGIYQVIRVFQDVSVRYVEEEEIRRFDPDLRSFLNVNRPDELRRMRELWQSSS